MKTTKPLWMNEPDQDQTSIRFNCPFCFLWLRKQDFEQHIQKMHPQVIRQKRANEKRETASQVQSKPAAATQ